MYAREPLYRPGPAWADVPAGLPLVMLLTGYRDAGSTVSQVTESILSLGNGRVVADFDPDPLYDYRARRPTIFIDDAQVQRVTGPHLDLRLVDDSVGEPFLLLSGFEPDFRWGGFIDDVLSFIDHFAVSTTTWVHAIPMPVPHTRPIRLSVTGNRPELIERLSVWNARTEAPAHVLHLLEHELTTAGDPVLDLVPLVPHYLADGIMPAGALVAIEAIATVTGLLLPTEHLRDEDRTFSADVERQVSQNEEAQKLIQALEVQHDDYLREAPDANPLTNLDGGLPSADELAAELERFLSTRRDGDE